MEATTSVVPCSAASEKSGTRSLARKQLSITTLELSTIIPMAITRPPSVMIFRENPIIDMTITVINKEIGMEHPTIIDAFQSPKKINSTIMERITPSAKVLPTELRDSIIISEAS